MIAARLDRLASVERAVLERAAIVGKVFAASCDQILVDRRAVRHGRRWHQGAPPQGPDPPGSWRPRREKTPTGSGICWSAMPCTRRCRRSSAQRYTSGSRSGSSGRRGPPGSWTSSSDTTSSSRIGIGRSSVPSTTPGRAIADRAGVAPTRGRRARDGTWRLCRRRTTLRPSDRAAAGRRPRRALRDAVARTGAVLQRSTRASARVRRGGIRAAADAGARGRSAHGVAILSWLIRNHLDPDFAMRSVLMEIEDHMTSLEAADDELGFAERGRRRSLPILARRRRSGDGGHRTGARLRRARRIPATHADRL